MFLVDLSQNDTRYISKDLSAYVLDPNEIIRLNPKAALLEEIQSKANSEKDGIIILPSNLLIVETKNMRIARYLIDFTIAYEKSFMFMSSRQAGKTLLLKTTSHGKIEKNELKIIRIATTKHMSIKQVNLSNFL